MLRRIGLRCLLAEQGGQGIEAAGAALAAALIIAALLGVSNGDVAPRVMRAMSCAATVLGGGGGGCDSTSANLPIAAEADDDDGGGSLWDRFTDGLGDVLSGVGSVFSGVGDFLGDAWNWLGDTLGKVRDFLVNAWNTAWRSVFGSSRGLSPEELAAAREVLGDDTIDWDQVQIRSGGALLDAIFAANGNRPFTVGHTIYVPGDGTLSPETAVHELMHVYQFEQRGWIYIPESLIGQAREGQDLYDYGGPEGLERALAEGRTFADFNVEQQAHIAEDYYNILHDAPGWEHVDPAIYEPFIEQMRNGDLSNQRPWLERIREVLWPILRRPIIPGPWLR